MLQVILGLFVALADILRAFWDVVCRRKRGRYQHSVVVRAPRDAIWQMMQRPELTYAATGMRVVTAPLAGHDGVHLAQIFIGVREALGIAYRYQVLDAPSRMVFRYEPALSSAPQSMGRNDDVTVTLEELSPTTTRLTYTRDLEHTHFATRISAPLGVRQAVQLTSGQAEYEAGIRPAPTKLWHQLVWTVLAFASFAWLLDWRAAIALMIIIAIHEAGHALAMLWYGLGVSVVSFVPFLGGVAAPKRPYQTEVQRVVVALMGVAFSLPFSLLALWIASLYDMPNLAVVALLSIIVNAANLVPFPALDGSIVVSILLAKLHSVLNLAVSILMFGLFVAVGVLLRDPLMWIAIAISFISVVQVMSLRTDDHLKRMGRLATAATVVGFVALLGAHAAAFYWATMTAARAESNLTTACIKERNHTVEAIHYCRAQNRIWLVDR